MSGTEVCPSVCDFLFQSFDHPFQHAPADKDAPLRSGVSIVWRSQAALWLLIFPLDRC